MIFDKVKDAATLFQAIFCEFYNHSFVTLIGYWALAKSANCLWFQGNVGCT